MTKIRQILFIFALTFSVSMFSSCATVVEILDALSEPTTNNNEKKKKTDDGTEQGKRKNSTDNDSGTTEQGKRKR